MALRLFEKKPKEDTFLKLIQVGPEVRLIVCDSKGVMVEGGCILSLTEEGVELQSGMNPRLGFKLDKDGTIICETV